MSGVVASVAVEQALLVLKIAFLVLLYLFIWRIVRAAARDVRLPQESVVLAPSREHGGRVEEPRRTGRLVVLASPAAAKGREWILDSAAVTAGRSNENDIELGRDEFASAQHARFEPRADGVWVQDVGSTNGTYVNGRRVTSARKLSSGDVVRIGATELRYEP